MFVIFNNKTEIYYPGTWSIRTHHLLPYIDHTSVFRNPDYPWEGRDHTIEMGIYDLFNDVKYHTPFVWNHIKILSLTIDERALQKASVSSSPASIVGQATSGKMW